MSEDKNIRHAYATNSGANGMIYIHDHQWTTRKPESNHFDFAKEEKMESFVWQGKIFKYVGSFTGDFIHVVGNESEKAWNRKFEERCPTWIFLNTDW